jgi:hypothetical protein
MVITNSVYTPSAKALAKANNVELWDKQKVMDEIAKLPANIEANRGILNSIPQHGS